MPPTLDEQILLSSIVPTPASRARLAALAPAVTDWAALVQRAETLSLAPLLRLHLAHLQLFDTLPMLPAHASTKAITYGLHAISLTSAKPNVCSQLWPTLEFLPCHSEVADTARLFEYLDFSSQPLARLRRLGALLFTNRAHLKQLYGNESNVQNYARRPFDLLWKLPWASLRPATLWRVWRLRQIQSSSKPSSKY